jgi:hypothetical protein
MAGAATAVAALALLTACHSGADAAGGGDAGTTATATAAAAGAASSPAAQAGASTAAAGAGTGKTIKVCDVISAAQAGKIAGQPYTVAVPQKADWTSRCAYNNDASTTEGVNVSYSAVNAENTWNLVHTGTLTDISGLGDKAFWDNDNTLYALTGSDLVQVNGLDSQQQSESLAKLLVDALH